MKQDYADPNWRHPYDSEDDEDDYAQTVAEIVREFGKKAIFLISAVLDEIPDSPKKWGIAFGIGATCCAGRSMSEVAAKLGVTRALISHYAKEFCRRYQLPPSPYMKAKN